MPTNYATIIVTGSPVNTSELNDAITAQNAAGFWVTDIKFSSPDMAILLALDHGSHGLGFTSDQKVVGFDTPTQGDLDASHAAEIGDSMYPTGVFVNGAGLVFILYHRLAIVGAP